MRRSQHDNIFRCIGHTQKESLKTYMWSLAAESTNENGTVSQGKI